MSLMKSVDGQPGSGKRAHVINRCHLQILGDQTHVRPRMGRSKCIGYFTPLYTPDPANPDDPMHSLKALNVLYDGFDLSNPVGWDTIDLNRYRHIVFDALRLNDNGTGSQPFDHYTIRSVEFTILQFCNWLKKMRRRDVSLTFITDQIPACWTQALNRVGIKDVHLDSINVKEAA